MCGYNINNSSINRNIKSSSWLSALLDRGFNTTTATTTTTNKTTTIFSALYKDRLQLPSCWRRRTNVTNPVCVCFTKSLFKWHQIVLLSIIILLLCCTSHVLALRKGRLMAPTTFTALSGDLHVQIQFIQDDNNNGNTSTNNNHHITTATTIADTTTNNKTTRFVQPLSEVVRTLQAGAGTSAAENIITSTLVISKYIDEVSELEVSTQASATTSAVAITLISNTNASLAEEERHKILQRQRKEIVRNIPLYPDPRHNITQIKVPCQTFIQGGFYEMQVVTNLKTFQRLPSKRNRSKKNVQNITTATTTLVPSLDERLKQTLDVRWPSAEIIVSPVRLLTYPDTSVEVTLRFPEVNCDGAWLNHELPEFWLELIYCGRQRSCSQLLAQNISQSSILFKEQVRGYPKYKIFKLKCDLFGLAGNYAVQLRPMVLAPNIPITRRFLSVDWSDKYVFNVYARSIFPCDPHSGIGVLYEYPSCILDQGDRVRVYAKLRADVASLKPPTTLHYIAEQRVVKNQYSLYFSCDIFTEKFVEYCFVYVTHAVSGAVADVRMDCLPTLPVKESDTGGWGPWSDWTPCSTTCLGGTRNRYRFCDSPPPRYGAKFCEGPSVETEKCGNSSRDVWDCIYENSGSGNSQSNPTAVSQEIGPGCRCGCIVHLGSSKSRRILAGATQSCPGRSFWLIQVDDDEFISMEVNFLHLPCATQYIKIRDGPSLSSTLVVEVQGTDGTGNADIFNAPIRFKSTGAQLLLEFFAGEDLSLGYNNNKSSNGIVNFEAQHNNLLCTGGFLANVEQLANNMNTTNSDLLGTPKNRILLKKTKSRWHEFTLVHLSAIVFASFIILISSFLGSQYVMRYRKYHLAVAKRKDEGSCLHTPRNSLTSLQGPPSRALSTTTLISEVIYMIKMRPKKPVRHSILRESIDAENLPRETEMNEDLAKKSLVNCGSEFSSNTSIMTLRNEMVSPISEGVSRCSSCEGELNIHSLNSTVAEENPYNCDTLTLKDKSKDSESIISTGMSSICYSPTCLSKPGTINITQKHLEERIKMADSLRSFMHNRNNMGCPAILTNGRYSPATSIISSATIRSTTCMKESKEKQNRKKLMARPSSECSLGNHDDFELDYYDYNVTNNSSVPGSYLGMDPAYLIWIPPFDDISDTNEHDNDNKTPQPQELEETQPLYEEIRIPQYTHYLSPHSNTNSSNNTTSTTPTPEELSSLSSNVESKVPSPNETDLKNSFIRRVISVTNSTTNKSTTPYFNRKKLPCSNKQSKSTLSLDKKNSKESIAMLEINATKSDHNVNHKEMETDINALMISSYIEKETTVVKSPSDLQQRLNVEDLQFADESESDHDGKFIDIKRSAKEILKEECKVLRHLKRVSTAIAVNKAQTIRRTQV